MSGFAGKQTILYSKPGAAQTDFCPGGVISYMGESIKNAPT